VIGAHQIKSIGDEFGIDDIKVTTAQPFLDAAARITQQKDAGLYLNSETWHRRDFNPFCDVRTVLPKAKSIIAACQCYLTNEKIVTGPPGNPHGLVARYTWRNHYRDLKMRLQKVAGILEDRYSAGSVVFSNGIISEKPIAERSGIGYFGKHSIIIHQHFGSWIVLGEIITDIDIAPDPPAKADCGECSICIDECPTQAIIEPYILDRRRCIQALTNWYGELPEDIARVWGNRLYGCSLCQDVCPANSRVKASRPRTDIGFVGSSVPLTEILTMQEEEYRRRYANNQMTARWINFKSIQRNALIALGNIHDEKTLPVLERMARNHDQVLANSARWAIRNFDRT
jgi:epoxyqueuosine reductase